ncbi:hypothetical protein [Streptomyces huiliensis]|uniref:hypothetical protein n=1 Tax=Streptomyces huiliensis TaxID=2876027 RepID=UPI001CC039F8|nr:hypothetical protein [Streptomyces huiliensis]MBZ4321133.1 hypothetical protein [Streptomyces huiliensis]
MPEYDPPAGFPARLLNSEDMEAACRARDFATVFRLAKRAGIHPALIGRRCLLTPSRVAEILKGQRKVVDIQVVERIADGLRIPGLMLGLAPRAWEQEFTEGARPAPPGSTEAEAADEFAPAPSDSALAEETCDPAFVADLVASQLTQHYRCADFFGARHTLPPATHQMRTLAGCLVTATGPRRTALLRTASRMAEFVGWLHQDLGHLASASYWSDRSMEWAQEAADDHMQAYVLFRKSNQAAIRSQGAKVVSLARAAQRLPDLPPRLKALAAQQEAQGYSLMRNSRAAHAKFDEALALASQPDAGPASGVDTSYCTPEYVEIQRATCRSGLGEPEKAIAAFQAQLAGLPPIYRNDRGVYLARLARAYTCAGEHGQAVGTATQALTIASQTGSARTMAELTAVADAVRAHCTDQEVSTFLARFETISNRLSTGHAQPQHEMLATWMS